MTPESVKSRVLRSAAERVGSVEKLAEALGVTKFKLQRWLEGAAEPPDEIFLKAVDIVLGPEKPGH